MFHSYNHKKQMHNDKNRCAFFKIMEDLIIIKIKDLCNL